MTSKQNAKLVELKKRMDEYVNERITEDLKIQSLNGEAIYLLSQKYQKDFILSQFSNQRAAIKCAVNQIRRAFVTLGFDQEFITTVVHTAVKEAMEGKRKKRTPLEIIVFDIS